MIRHRMIGPAAVCRRLVRGLVALLATPFLLLAVLVIGCWLKASGRLAGGIWQR
jgi:hypothetical protein